jgi:hypothetical protein
MFSDPLSVTYNSVAKSLARSSGSFPGIRRQLAQSVYRDAAQEFSLQTGQYLMADGSNRSEIILSRLNPDSDTDPFNAGSTRLPNSVGLVFTRNSFGWNTSTDVPLLQTALTTLVDSTLRGRLLAGEY